jgi:predicted enzyme related to lactoylglutathione lyase
VGSCASASSGYPAKRVRVRPQPVADVGLHGRQGRLLLLCVLSALKHFREGCFSMADRTHEVRLDRITIAVGDMDRMVAFYQQVFRTALEPRSFGPYTMYLGEIGGIQFQLCPREAAGVSATENLHQLRFVVPDLKEGIAAALAAGGSQVGEVAVQGTRQFGCVRDPDGNTIELLEESATV